MRKFLLGLAVYAVALSLLGGALGVSEADAGKAKLVYVKCKATNPPHWSGTKIPCAHPGFWELVPYKWAVRVGIYPIILNRSLANWACANGHPKVVRTPGASSWRLIGQRCVKQGIG